MAEEILTPAEAADGMAAWLAISGEPEGAWTRRLRVLIGHARSTAEVETVLRAALGDANGDLVAVARAVVDTRQTFRDDHAAMVERMRVALDMSEGAASYLVEREAVARATAATPPQEGGALCPFCDDVRLSVHSERELVSCAIDLENVGRREEAGAVRRWIATHGGAATPAEGSPNAGEAASEDVDNELGALAGVLVTSLERIVAVKDERAIGDLRMVRALQDLYRVRVALRRLALRAATPTREAAPGDLGALVDAIGAEVGLAPGQPDLVLSHVAGWMEDARRTNAENERLRGHRCQAAPEIVTGDEARDLPEGSIIGREADLLAGTDARIAQRVGGAWVRGTDPNSYPDVHFRVLHRAPVPTAPLAVGDTVETRSDFERVPEGARFASCDAQGNVILGTPVVDVRNYAGDWSVAEDDAPFVVLTLPEATS